MEEHSRNTYLSWRSPSRLFKKRDKEFFRNIGAIVFLLFVILFFAREFPLILAMISVAFLVYVFSTVPPEEIDHKVTNLGLETAGHFYRWEELKEFWFEEQWGQKLLVVIPEVGPRIIMLLGDIPSEKAQDVLSRFIHYREEPEKSLVDNAASWLSRKIPLEKPA